MPKYTRLHHRFNPLAEFNTGGNPQQAACYNLKMSVLIKINIVCLGTLALFLAGCMTAQTQQLVTPAKETYQVTPYRTPTSTSTPLPLAPGTATPFPTPSPTPRLHTIQSGETLLAIAAQYGVTLEELLLANPEVNPSLVPIGLNLVIPGGSGNSTSSGVIEPALLTVIQQPCIPTGDGGTWCYAMVTNELGGSVERISLAMSILDQNGSEVSTRLTAAPLNLLHDGEIMPVGIYFPPPLPDTFHLGVKVASALPYEGIDDRYLTVTSIDSRETLSEDRMQAVINGTVSLQNPERLARLSILAAAYTAEGGLAAMRVWRTDFPQGSSAVIPFEIVVYSMGGEIDRVDILAEADAQD